MEELVIRAQMDDIGHLQIAVIVIPICCLLEIRIFIQVHMTFLINIMELLYVASSVRKICIQHIVAKLYYIVVWQEKLGLGLGKRFSEVVCVVDFGATVLVEGLGGLTTVSGSKAEFGTSFFFCPD